VITIWLAGTLSRIPTILPGTSIVFQQTFGFKSVYFFNHWFPKAHPGIYEPI
jgi:hypothetical protein